MTFVKLLFSVQELDLALDQVDIQRTKAERELESRLALGQIEANFLPACLLTGMTRVQTGALEEARDAFLRGYEFSGGAPAFLAGTGLVHAASGASEAARGVIQELAELVDERYVPAFYTATIHAALGDRESALTWLGRAVDERSESVLYLGVEPLFDGLRSDPRFQELLRRVGIENAP